MASSTKTTTTASVITTIAATSYFLAGAACVAGISWLQQKRQRKRQSTKKSSSKRTSTTTIPPALRQEQLSRHILYFGDDGMASIQQSRVCVVGVGGVGSHCAVMLARGGLQNNTLRVIDFDQVTLSSLNRHACATLQDVGISKVQCLQQYCADLGVEIEAIPEMFTAESAAELLKLAPSNNQKHWDMVIDCIDDVPTKAALLAYCLKHHIKVLSCMGAGGKSDMTRLHISDLRTASRDPLASKLRQTLKKVMKKEQQNATNNIQANNNNTDDYAWMDDMDQLTIIYSSEKPVVKLADLSEEQKAESNKSQFGNVDGMRIRVLPVLGPLPAIMGQSLAAMALCELGHKPIHQPMTGERVGRNVRHKLYQHLNTREQRIAKGELLKPKDAVTYTGPLEIDHDDVEYLLGVWRNRCAITGQRLGASLSLARWDLNRPATTDNLVLMASHALQAFDEKGKEESVAPDIQRRIEARLAGCLDMNNVDW